MNNDCLHVQEAISRAADGDKVTAQDAALAKRHCSECAECAAFARVLVAMKRNPVPGAPDDVVERGLGAVRELRQADKLDAARAAAATRAAATPAAASNDTDAAAESPATTVRTGRFISLSERDARGVEVVRIGRAIISQQRFVALMASAAVLLIVIVVAADQGARFMNEAQLVSEDTAADLRAAEDGEVIQSPSASEDYSGSAASGPNVAAAAAQYVVFEDRAYRYVGTSSAEVDELTEVGKIKSALDSGGPTRSRTVYTSDAANQIIVEGEDGLLNFALATRTLGGEVFALASEPLEAFGLWPTLPSGTPEPSTSDGGSTFTESGVDDQGVTIFTRPGRAPKDGFAVAPGTAAGDPAAGNPGWTWWEPLN